MMNALNPIHNHIPMENAPKEGGSGLEYQVLTKDDLLKILPFGKTKLDQLLQAGILPVIKIGRDYITNHHELDEWFKANRGKELFY